MRTPAPILAIYVLYLLVVWQGPKVMRSRAALSLKHVLIPYNLGMQVLSLYMCIEVSTCQNQFSEYVRPVSLKPNILNDSQLNAKLVSLVITKQRLLLN